MCLKRVNKICELQERVCEYERFMFDLTVMLAMKKRDLVLPRISDTNAVYVVDRIRQILRENEEMARKLQEK